MNKRKYIVLGLTAQGLSILRELGRAGADVTALCQSERNVGYHSRYGEKRVFHSVQELKGQVAAIVAKAEQKPICHISSGEILALVLREYREIYDICEVYSSPLPLVERLAHKDEMYGIAAECGMKFARFVTLDKYTTGALMFPIFLKRNYEIPLFFKAVKVDSEQELQHDYIDRIPQENLKDVIAQEFIDIPHDQLLNLSCQGYYVAGKCMGLYLADQKRRLKKGITSCIEEVTDEEIRRYIFSVVKDFMAKTDYTGFAEFEFMYDKRCREAYFIEVNTRPCGLQSGMSLKFNNIADVLQNPRIETPLEVKRKKLMWMNIVRDVRARIENRDFRSLFDIFQCRYDIFDLHDIRPFFSQFIRI